MTDEGSKICPLKFVQVESYEFPRGGCEMKRCAWYVDERNGCAVWFLGTKAMQSTSWPK